MLTKKQRDRLEEECRNVQREISRSRDANEKHLFHLLEAVTDFLVVMTAEDEDAEGAKSCP